MRPVVDGIEEEYAGKLIVVRLDFNAKGDRALVQALAVRGHPTTVVLDRDRQETKRFLGPVSAETLDAAVRAVVE